jgi:hypothetical protein
MSKTTIVPEMADIEFERLCGFFDVDTNTEGLAMDEKESMTDLSKKITRAIVCGGLTVGDDGAPTYVTKAGTALTFKAPTGATLLVKTADDDPIRKMLAIAMDLTGGKTSPAKLSIRDTGVLSAIVNLFMSELA